MQLFKTNRARKESTYSNAPELRGPDSKQRAPARFREHEPGGAIKMERWEAAGRPTRVEWPQMGNPSDPGRGQGTGGAAARQNREGRGGQGRGGG